MTKLLSQILKYENIIDFISGWFSRLQNKLSVKSCEKANRTFNKYLFIFLTVKNVCER